MPGNNQDRDSDRQTVAEWKYASLKLAVEEAGGFAPHVLTIGGWDRLVCASHDRKQYGYTGTTISVTEIGGSWYLVTPHPFHFRVRNPAQAAPVVVAFLWRGKKGKKPEVARSVDLESALLQINCEEFLQAIDLGKDK